METNTYLRIARITRWSNVPHMTALTEPCIVFPSVVDVSADEIIQRNTIALTVLCIEKMAA